MIQPLQVVNERDRQRFCELACPSNLTVDTIERQKPDAGWMLIDRAGAVVARCSIWWQGCPPYENHRLGLIGHFAAKDAATAGSLLQLACTQLVEHGCTLAVGPMDGNTWQRYRLLTERGSEPTFFLEPDNPDDWPSHFTENGFTPLAHYHSALNCDLSAVDPRTADIARRIEERGIALRSIAMDRFEDELRAIHALSLASFGGNFLYTPIGEADFIAQYRGVQRYVRTELVLLAEIDGRPIGFIFAIPDLNQAKRGQAIDTVIIKSMAVHPDRGGIGLGSLLMARCQEAARFLSYKRAIHALFHEANASGKISRHTAQVIRRYTLFERPLAPFA